jgi:hypothetical protein
MADAPWPVNVNQAVYRDSYEELPEDNIAEFKSETGPPKRRQRTSIASDLLNFEGRVTAAERVALRAFHRVTLKNGSLPFTRNHPYTGVTGGSYVFEKPPQYRSLSGTRLRVTYSLWLLP